MAERTQRPGSLPLEPPDSNSRAAAEDLTTPYSSELPDTTARRLRPGGVWRDAAMERDRASLSTDEVADGLARARQLYRHPRMQRLARRSA